MMASTMMKEEAQAFAKHLVRESGPLRSGGRMCLRAHVVADRIVFCGGSQGEHSLAFEVSTKERVLAHWGGYVENNGLAVAPVSGQKVSFPSASASSMGGWRTGTVLSVGPKRVRIAYRFKHGGAAETTVPIRELRF